MSEKAIVDVCDLPLNIKTTKIYQPYPLQTLEEAEAKYIQYFLNHTKWNKAY